MRSKVDTDREKNLINEIRRLDIVKLFTNSANKKVRKITDKLKENSKIRVSSRISFQTETKH